MKRNILTQDYKYGGLKSPVIRNLITPLKTTWLERLYQQNATWTKRFESTTGLTTKDLVIYGDYFIEIKK